MVVEQLIPIIDTAVMMFVNVTHKKLTEETILTHRMITEAIANHDPIGAKAAMGNFAAFSAIPGVEVRTVFFDPVNSLVSGSMTEQQWIDGIKSASDQMRANIVE